MSLSQSVGQRLLNVFSKYICNRRRSPRLDQQKRPASAGRREHHWAIHVGILWVKRQLLLASIAALVFALSVASPLLPVAAGGVCRHSPEPTLLVAATCVCVWYLAMCDVLRVCSSGRALVPRCEVTPTASNLGLRVQIWTPLENKNKGGGRASQGTRKKSKYIVNL